MKVQRGVDPVTEKKRREAVANKTVSAILDQFIERYAKPNLRSADQYESTSNAWLSRTLAITASMTYGAPTSWICWTTSTTRADR